MDETSLDRLIRKYDTTPAPELEFDVNEHLEIYNFLQELKLYHKLCGTLKEAAK